MNVLLINPPCENEITAALPAVIKKERGCNPPLGLLYLAGYLEKFSSHKVTIIDAQVEELSYQSLMSRIGAMKADVVGITAMTMTLIDVIKTVNIVNVVKPGIKIVLGGPHVHLYPRETISLANVDYLVIGEGEKTFKNLLDNIDDKAELRKIPGLVFKNNGEIVNTGFSLFSENLDEIPFPARHLVPYKKYTSVLTQNDVITTVITSRGCPFKCTFCNRLHLGKKFRARSADNIVEELEECTRMGINTFLFYDDSFTINKKRVIEICEKIVERQLKINWNIRTRVDVVDEELIRHLSMAGCKGIHYGVESGTEKILKILRKDITIEQILKAFYLTAKYKIATLAYFMIGNPTETLEDIKATFQLMRKLRPDYAHITVLIPFPGTKIYLDGQKQGVIKKDYWKEFAQNPMSDFKPPYWEELFSQDELNSLLIKGYKQFYSRPLYIVKRLIKIKSFSDFKKKATAGIRILTMKG